MKQTSLCLKRSEILNVRFISMALLLMVSLYVLFLGRGMIPYRFRQLFIVLLPFSVSYLITPFACALAYRLNILDQPGGRKVHSNATPLLGGLVIYAAFVLGAVSTLWYSTELKGVVYASSLIFIVGLIDDKIGLSSIFRLAVQVAAVFILFYHGLQVNFVPDNTPYSMIEKFVTLVWVIGLTNAVNFLDGLDGLCTGFGAIAAMSFGLISYLTGQYFLMFLAFSLAGSCLGFLPWNFRRNEPARIFLGDSGSNFLGFTLASFALMGEWAENNVVALAVPVLILLLPIYDTSMITFFRIREGLVHSVREWLDYVGKDHLHHRLYLIGIGKHRAVLSMYALTMQLGISAVIIRTGGVLEAWLALMQAAIILIGLTAFIVNIRKKYDRFEKECDNVTAVD